MVAILKNFVAIRKERGDLLDSTSFRSIVEALYGILEKDHHNELVQQHKKLLKHLIDFTNPHYSPNDTFNDELVTRTYAIYTNMTASPLSFSDFTDQIVHSVTFLELLRRIVLNHYFYNRVKTNTGSVPEHVSVKLLNDASSSETKTPVNLTFGPGINNESDFIALGWNGNTTPVSTIFTADDLIESADYLPIIFQTSSVASSRINEGQITYPFSLPIASNDFTVKLNVVKTPLVRTSVFSLTNDTDVLAIFINPDRTVELTLNNESLIKTNNPTSSGEIEFGVSKKGQAFLKTYQSATLVTQTDLLLFTYDVPVSKGSILIPDENLTIPTFSMREVTVFAGYNPTPPSITVIVPDGYAIMTDSDGTWLVDPDGVPLMDYNVKLPEGYAFLVDDDGSFLKDSDDTFVVDKVSDDDYMIQVGFALPKGYAILVDPDQAWLRDRGGAILIEKIN